MPKPVAIAAEGDIEYTYEIVPTDTKRTVDPDVRDPSIQSSVSSSRGGVHPSAGFEVAARRASNTPFTASSLKQSELFGIRLTKPPAISCSSRSGQLSRSLARRHGKIHSRPFGPRLSDALHGEGRPVMTRPASDWYSQRARPRKRCLPCQLANDHDPVSFLRH